MLLRRDLMYAFLDFAETLAQSCNFSTKVVTAPIRVSAYIYRYALSMTNPYE